MIEEYVLTEEEARSIMHQENLRVFGPQEDDEFIRWRYTKQGEMLVVDKCLEYK